MAHSVHQITRCFHTHTLQRRQLFGEGAVLGVIFDNGGGKVYKGNAGHINNSGWVGNLAMGCGVAGWAETARLPAMPA